MNPFTLLQLSAYAGLLATGLLTLNFLLGMMISTAYSKNRYWKLVPPRFQKINITELHNWTAYVALLLVLLHIVLLVADSSSRFNLINVLFPIDAPHQPLFTALGTISTYALLVVIFTTQKVVKRKLGFRTWKNIHLISYGTALLFLIHGVAMDPRLKDRPIDYIDAEKLISEGCLFVLIIASVLRYKYYRQVKQAKHENKMQKIAGALQDV